jgi:peptidoglycan hydrolase-like protein with peptidoglycan-binding domain
MTLRNAMHLGLTLWIMAGSGVLAKADTPQTQTSKATGTASKSTGKSSHRSTKKASAKHKEKGQMAPTPDRISEIQEALTKNGAFASAPNGKWDESTVEAMKRFQGAHGLNPSGKLDALTLEKLGLGSQTAGVAEPVAPPNSSSRLTNPSSQSSRP